MKKITGIVACFLCLGSLMGQGFTKLEYFFDTDPGIDNGIPISLGTTSDTINITAGISTASLPSGFHFLGLRVLHNDGVWGLFETRAFYISTPATADVTDIVAAEYFFDTDPGTGNGVQTSVGINGATVNFTAIIPTSLPTGFHFLAIRTKDANGIWGLFETRGFYISTPPSSDVTDIVAAEYFFDTDPGPGNGTPTSVGTSGPNVNFTAAIPTSLSIGFHNLSFRTKDANGLWGLFETRGFYISSPPSSDVTDIVAAEYFFDTDPGLGNGTPTSVGTNGANVNFTAVIPTSLSSGFHFLAIRTKDANGLWGLFETRGFYISSPIVPDMPIITAAEYFFDNDPGPGNANPLAVPSPGNTINLSSNIVAPCLAAGQHFMGLRIRDQLNNWSLFDYDTLTLTSGISAAVVTPAGPISMCSTDAVTLTATFVSGIAYQWLLNGVNISGATTNTFVVHAAGNYSLKTTCGGSFVTSNVVTVSINPNVSSGTVSGNSPLCTGFTTTYTSNGTTGGSWSSTNTSVATVNSVTGFVTAISEGNTDITYTISTGCGSPVSSIKTLNVSHDVNPGTVNGNSPLCIGASVQYSSDGEIGGTWSSSNPSVATVNATTGIVTCLSAGTTNIIYTIANNNCPRVSQRTLIVSPNASAGVISGTSSLCIGANATFSSNGNAGGTWSCDNTAIASINSNTGELSTLSAGTTTIRYTINSGCNAPVSSTFTITVNTNITAGTISGASSLCLNQTSNFTSNGTIGGSWSSSNTSIATVNPTTGLVTTMSGGSVDIIYTLNSGCGSPISSLKNLTVNSLPVGNAGNISGNSSICINSINNFTSDGDAGGTWSSSNTNVASINSTTGQISALSAGSTNIIYTVTGCNGPVTSQKTLTINPDVSAGVVNGVSSICIGASAFYFSNGTQGGTWTSSNTSVAIVNSVSGQVTGINNGSSLITYTISGCGGTKQASKTIAVSVAAIAGVINGALSLCKNESTSYTTNGTPGGVWSSSNQNVATINSVTGNINTLNTGTTTISYSVSGCNGTKTTSRTLNVIPIATAGTLSGESFICIGASTQYSSDGTNGGIWSSSNPIIATINSSTGLITSLNAGTTNITYSVTGCNSNFSASKQLSVSGHIPDFTFTGNSNFSSSVVFPVEGEPTFSYRFEIKYTDADGNLPAAGFPRIMLDFEGNGIFTDPKDMNITMLGADPLDNDVTNGKIYFINLSGLPLGKNWKVQFAAKESSGCETTSQIFPGPKVSTPPNLSIFADGITFSNDHPAQSSTIDVFAKLQNTSKDTVINFVVHLINQYDTTQQYPDIFVSELFPESEKSVSWSIVTPTLAAWVPMQVVIDYTNAIEETNELDNQAIRPFTNGNFNVPVRITLTAGGAATNCQGTFYTICGKAIYQNTAVPLKDNSVAGATITVHVNETGQEYSGFTNSQGNYCISFITSDTGQFSLKVSVTDFTLSRDTFFSYHVANCPPPSNDGPDLVSEITLDDSEIFSGESITGTLKITNRGNRNSGISVADMYLSSTGTGMAQQFPTPVLAPGEFYTTTFTFVSPITNGIEAIHCRADVNSDVIERNEQNNTNDKLIKICPLEADITAGGPTRDGLTPFFFICDSRVNFSINNPSCIDITEPFDVQYQLFENAVLVKSERLTITQTIPRETGINIQVDDLFPSAGNYILKFNVDINNSISEFNETNNLYSSPIAIFDCKAELDIGISCSPVIPQDPAIGNNISVQTTITNGGRSAVTTPFIVDFEVDGNHYPVTITSNIPINSSIAVSVTLPTPAYGCPVINAVVDATDVIEEYNEGGQAHADLSWDFSLGRQCFEFDPEEPMPNPNFWEEPHNVGDPVPLAIGLINHKTYSASLVRTRFEVSGPQINGWLDLGFVNTTNVSQSCSLCKTSRDIAPHAVTLPNSFVFPEVGIYHVRMTTDWDERYVECREDNNVMIVDVTITNSPDYRTLSKYIAPSLLNPEIGEPITIDVTYQNVGASNIVDSLDILVKVDDLPHQKMRSKGILTASTFTVHFNNQWASMKEGLHVIRAIVDPDKKINETDEFNNEATRSFVVGKAANLYFQVFTPSNSFPLIGEQITINTRIGNSGALGSESDLQFFYLNDNNDTILIETKHINVAGRDSILISIPWTVLDNSTTLIGRLSNLNILQIRYDDKEATAFLDNIGVSLTSKDACFGGADGSLTASMFGGNMPFTFNWSNGSNGAIMVAPPGTYTVTVVDAAGVARFKAGKIKGMFAPSFYEDADGDGFGNPSSIVEDCEQPIGYVIDNTDCNDANANIHPGVTEVCNDIDDNCDGRIDEGVLLTFYIDEDGDGFGTSTSSVQACTKPIGYVADNTDCNDTKNTAHPGATEVCNGIDDNCDGRIDEGVTLTFYQDADGDGFGDINVTTQDCTAPMGFVADNTDCNDDPLDRGPIVNPGRSEVCNGIDDNCNGFIDENVLLTFYRDADRDGYGTSTNSVQACTQPVGFVSNHNDCNDASAAVNPGGIELCNGIDDNCNNLIDNSDPDIIGQSTWFADTDGDGYGNIDVSILSCYQDFGMVADNSDCNDTNPNINPNMTEICNGIDDNCDGLIDENLLLTVFRDADGDGYGNPNNAIHSCTIPAGYVANNTDCNDNNLAIHPGAIEACNGIDDNCNGLVDEGCGGGCNMTVNAGPDEWTYYGYSTDQTVIHTAVVTGGTAPFNYSWTLNRPLRCNVTEASGDELFSGGTCQTTTCPSNSIETTLSANPSCSGSATINTMLLDSAIACITVIDKNGCKATDCFKIIAEDARCYVGNSNNHKVWICHKTNSQKNPWEQICVDDNAVAAHLTHGDYVGKCSLIPRESHLEKIVDDFIVYPNPTHDKLNIQLNSSREEECVLQLTDITGRLVHMRSHTIQKGNNHLEMDMNPYSGGMYTLSLINADEKRQVRVVVE